MVQRDHSIFLKTWHTTNDMNEPTNDTSKQTSKGDNDKTQARNNATNKQGTEPELFSENIIISHMFPFAKRHSTLSGWYHNNYTANKHPTCSYLI